MKIKMPDRTAQRPGQAWMSGNKITGMTGDFVPPKLPTAIEVCQIIDRIGGMHGVGLVAHLHFGHKTGNETARDRMTPRL
jgi:hypothetical protein